MAIECPSQDDLMAFLEGRLAESKLDAVADHLETCFYCEALAQGLDSAVDPVVRVLRKPAPIGTSLSTLPYKPSRNLTAPEHWPHLPGYEVLAPLGEGGMGVVYRALHLQLNRQVALKKLFREDSRARDRSRLEAETMAQLQHPNIVQIHEIIEYEGCVYLALELVQGGSLADRLQGLPQPTRATAQFLVTVARAVHHAHVHGVIHRDLKPANILLSQMPHEIPKITDFGVAKRLVDGPGQTQEGDVIGTPSYMAPEQAHGHAQEVSRATDVYSLGVILYEMLTGRVPLLGSNMLETLLMVRNEEPVPPHQLQSKIDRDLETICLKCLRKEPAKRYTDAQALADDLQRFLDGQPILARPTPIWEHAWKWARRRPGIAGLSAGVVLIIVVALVIVCGLWLRAEGEAEHARKAKAEAERAEADLALRQGITLCDQGDVARGMLWLARALERATTASAADLDRPVRINLAAWGRQLLPPGDRLKVPGSVATLAFDPTGQTLLAGGNDGQVHFFDLATGKETGAPLVAPRLGLPKVWVGKVAFSPDGRTIATSSNGAVVLWDAASRKAIGEPLLHPPGMIWGMAFASKDRLATMSDDGSARVWDLASRRVVVGPLWHAKGEGYYTLAVSPDGKILATTGPDGRVRRWDLNAGIPYGPALRHDSYVLEAVFSKDGQRLLTTTRGGTLHSWDLGLGRALVLPPHCIEVNSVALAPDGQTFATGTGLGIVRLWQTESLHPVGQVYRQASGVLSVAFSPDGRTLAMGTGLDGIRVVKLPPSTEAAPPLALGMEVHTVRYTPDGDRLLAGTRSGALWLDTSTGKQVGGFMSNPEQFGVLSTALSSDGHSLAMGRWAGELSAWRGRTEVWEGDMRSHRRCWVSSEFPNPVEVLAYSPDGRTLFSCSAPIEKNAAALWDVATGERLRPLLRLLAGVRVRQAVFHPNGRELVLACDDGRVRLWDVESDTEVESDRPMQHPDAVRACALDATGERLLTGCRDGTALVWDLKARRTLLEPLRHEAEVAAVAFSPNGQTLLTGSLDGTARYWDRETGKQLGPTLSPGVGVLALTFHPDGKRAATGDKAIRQWVVPSERQEGDPEQVRRWAERISGMRLDSQGVIREISNEELQRLRLQLEER